MEFNSACLLHAAVFRKLCRCFRVHDQCLSVVAGTFVGAVIPFVLALLAGLALTCTPLALIAGLSAAHL